MQRRQFLLGLLALSPLGISGCRSGSSGVRIACAGDSITFGLGLENRKKECYPYRLNLLLGDRFDVRNFGLSGTTVQKSGDHPYWTTKAYHESIAWEPKVVILKLGSNDTKPKNWKQHDQFAADLKAMVETYRNIASQPEVFLCLPAPAFPGRWGIRDSVIKNEMIPLIREVASSEACPLIDLYTALSDKAELFPDKVHPNKEGAALIAKTISDTLEKQSTVVRSLETSG